MKKLLFTTAFLSLLAVSCSKKEETTTEKESNTMLEEPKAETSATAATPIEQGKQLVEGADCLSCHKVDAKLIGPSYQDIAAKYTDADLDKLAGKIIDGGQGVWGEVPMTAHPGLSKDNAKLMVKYILSLKK